MAVHGRAVRRDVAQKTKHNSTVAAAIKLANGEKVEKVIDVPYQLITKDNMAEFVNRNQK